MCFEEFKRMYMLLQKWSKVKFKYCTCQDLYFTHIEIEFLQNMKESE